MDASKPAKSMAFRMALASVMAYLYSGVPTAQMDTRTVYQAKTVSRYNPPKNKSRLSKRKPHRVLKRR